MSNQPNQRQERIFKIFTPVRCMNRDQLPRYVEGNMTEVEKHLIEQHLVECDLCCAAILALQDKRHHTKYNQYSSELSNYLHREYTAVPKQQGGSKQPVRSNKPARATSDSLLSGFWVVMFIVIGGGSIYLLQEHLKNRPALSLASARASEIIPSTPMANIDSTYTEEKTVPVTPRDSIKTIPAALRDTVKKVTVKDTLKKAKQTDTATRVVLKKPDSAIAKVETAPKTTPPPPPPVEKEKKEPEKKEEPAPKKEEPAAEEKPNTSADESLFRASMQYQQQGSIDNAIDGFRRLSTNYKYAERAKYQLALCYRMKGQHAKAKKLFKEIVKMDGSLKDKAQSQLDN